MSSPNASSSDNFEAKRDNAQDETHSERIQSPNSVPSEYNVSTTQTAHKLEEIGDPRTQQFDKRDDATSNSSETERDDDLVPSHVMEDEETKARFSCLINALINYKINEAEIQYQRRHATRPNHFEENIREEATILDKLAGPEATDAEKKKVSEGAAEVRRRLAERATESVAESVARDAKVTRPLRTARAARRKAAKYDRELAGMKRLAARAFAEEEEEKEEQEDREEGGEKSSGMMGAAAILDDLAALERAPLRPLRELLSGPDFQALKSATGSLDEAVKTLFDIAWAEDMIK